MSTVICPASFRAYTYVLLSSLILISVVPAEAARMTDEQRREHCLNNPCPGNDQPPYNWKTEQPFKRGGKWFVGPKEYFSMDKGVFYWPSKSPGFSANKSFPEAPEIRAGNFQNVAIEFFIEAKKPIGEMQEFATREQAKLGVAKREQLRPDLERIELKSSKSGPTALYIAQSLKTPLGQQPILSCNHRDPTYGCGSHFAWKKGLILTIRFNQRHGKDWPDIYSEITRVLNLVEEK